MDGVAQLWEAALENPYTRQNMPPGSSSTPGMSSLGRAEDGWRPSSSAPGEGHPGEDQVHVQRPPPGQVLGEQAAEQQAHRAAGPAIAPNTPNAVLRSFGSVKVVVSSDSAEGTRIAANAPCRPGR